MNTPVRHFLVLHFAGCILIAFFGAALGTGLIDEIAGYRRKDYLDEVRILQFLALTSAFVTSILTAYLLRPKEAPQRSRLIRHFTSMTAILVASHFLWVQPIWGFHHDITLGAFAWIFLGGEDGFFIFPNIIGLLPTVLFYWMLIKLVLISRSVKAAGT